jgi:hypothetical protein
MSDDPVARAAGYLRRWTAAHPGWQYSSAEEIATDLMTDADWTTINLGGWLRSPDGATITGIVRAVLPFPTNVAVDLLVEAITTASRQQTRNQRLGTLFVGGVAAALVWMLANS